MKRWILSLLLLAASYNASARQQQAVVAADRPVTVSATGLVAPRQAIRFGPPPSRSWRITITKLAREGQRVKAGDVLAEFDGSETDDRIRSKTAELAAKRSELESVLEDQARAAEEDKVSLAEAESEARKAARKANVDATVYAGLDYQKLVEEKSVTEKVARFERERVQLAAKVRALTLDELRADIRRLESELAAAEKELASFTVRAPEAGLVIIGNGNDGAKLDVNEAVNPGMTVVELIDDSDLIIVADVPEFAAARLAEGQTAMVSLDAAGGSELSGTVIGVSSIVRRQSRFSQAMVRSVEIALDEANDWLRPGMSAKVTLTVDTENHALAIPEDALRYREGRPGVMVVGKGWTPVELGRSSAGLRIVRDGLSEGVSIEW